MRFLIALVLLSSCAQLAGASTAYYTTGSETINTLNTSTQVQTRVQNAPTGTGLFLSPDEQSFYVLGSAAVTAIDRKTNRRIETYVPAHEPFGNVLAITPDQTRLFIGTCSNVYGANCLNGWVEVFDTATGAELAEIPFGNDQVGGIAVGSNGNAVFVGHYTYPYCPFCGTQPTYALSNALTAIEVSSLTISYNISLPSGAGAVVLSPNGQTAYVAIGLVEENVAIAVVDLTSRSVTAHIPGVYAVDLSLSRDGSTLAAVGIDYYYPAWTTNVTFIGTAKLVVLGTVQMTPAQGIFENHVVISADGSTAYVSGQGGSVYTFTSRPVALTGTLPMSNVSGVALAFNGDALYTLNLDVLGVLAEGATTPSLVFDTDALSWIALSPDGATVYVAGALGIWVGDAATGTQKAIFDPADGTQSIVASPDGTTLYVTGYTLVGEHDLLVMNAETGEVETEVSLPASIYSGLYSLAITPNGSTVYINTPGETASAFDTASRKIVATIPVSPGLAVAVSPNGDLACIPSTQVNSLFVSTATNTVVGTAPVVGQAVVFSADGSKVYVAGASNISIIDTATFGVTGTLNAYASPGETLAVTPDGKYLYAIGGGEGLPYETYPTGSIVDLQTSEIVPLPSGSETGGAIAIH